LHDLLIRLGLVAKRGLQRVKLLGTRPRLSGLVLGLVPPLAGSDDRQRDRRDGLLLLHQPPPLLMCNVATSSPVSSPRMRA